MTKYYNQVEVNTMSYTLTHLTSQLILVSWRRTPIADEAKAFIQALQELLDTTTHPLYFISDLRRGRIVDVRIIHQLSQLTQHANWAGSTAFSQNPISKIFLGSFQRLLNSTSDKNVTFDHPEDAIAFIDDLCPGLKREVDWQTVLDDGSGTLHLD
jgi:hypothetical protein